MSLVMKRLLPLMIISAASCLAADAQIHRVAQNTEQIRALGRQKTVVILTRGILEQHGPHCRLTATFMSTSGAAKDLPKRLPSGPDGRR